MWNSWNSSKHGYTTKAAQAEWVKQEHHPLLNLLSDPNPVQCQWQLIFSTVAALNLTGQAIWWITDGGGVPNIWPIPASWAEPVDALRRQWKIRPFGTAEAITVSGEYVVFFNLPDPSNPFGSVSPLQAQAAAIDTDEHLQAAQSYGFQNFVRPSMILKAGRLDSGPGTTGPGALPVLTVDQRNQLIRTIKAAYSGVHRNGEPLILDGMIEDVYEYQAKNEMDFVESGKQTRGRIFQAFGVNPLICGEIEGANRAQAVVAEESFCSNVVNPLLSLMNSVINNWLPPLFASGNERLFIEIEPARAHDPDQRFKEWQLGLTRNAVTVNEYRREILNLPPIPGGDELITSPPAISPTAAKLAAAINPYNLKRLVSDGN